jgi:protein TonB
VAAVVSLALNATLLLGLAWWSATTEQIIAPKLLATPLRVVDLPQERPRPSPAQPEVAAAIEPSQPTLPAPPWPLLRSVAPLKLTAATPESPALQMPTFAPQRISITTSSTGPSEAPRPPEVASPWNTTRSAVLIQPPDLSLYYPYRARVREVTGTTRIELRVAADGRVTAANVLSSSPPGIFDHAARRVAQALQFQPALDQGRPIPSKVSITIEWRIPE